MSKYRQIAEDIFENAPDWHSTEDLVDAVEAAIEDAVEAQKRACAKVVFHKMTGIKTAYYGLSTWNMIVAILDQVIDAILGL